MRERCFRIRVHKLSALTFGVYRPLLLIVLLSCGTQCTAIAFGQSQAAQDPAVNAKVAAARRIVKEAKALENQGSLESLQKAIDKYQEALIIFHSIPFPAYEAVIHATIAGVHSDIGEQQKALDSYNQAPLLLRAMRDQEHEAVTLNAIGNVYEQLGDILQALNNYAQAWRIQRALRDRSGEAQTTHNIALLYSHFGENQKALEIFNRALAMMRALADSRGEGITLNDIGLVYLALGDNSKALDYFNQALVIARNVGNHSGEATSLASIANVYRASGDSQKALDYFNQALAILNTVVDRTLETAILDGIAGIYGAQGDYQKALDYYNRALPLVRAIGYRRGEASTLSNIGLIYRRLGQGQKARDYYNQGLAAAIITGDRHGEATTLSNLMALWTTRNPSLAIFYGKQAINIYQQLRANITGLDKELQKTFLKTKELTYRALADLLISQGRLSEAQQVLNLFKDQQFFDFNQNTPKTPASLTFTPREARTADRYGRITKSDDVLTVLKQAEEEFAHTDAEQDKIGDVSDTRELQRALRELGQKNGSNAVAIYTLVSEASLRTLLITADKITAASQPIKSDDVSQKALQLWGLLQSEKYDPLPLAQEMYTIVFKPIEAQLPRDTKTILWSLDGNLRYLPMAALYDGKHYLIERYNHVVFTRAESERLLRTVSPHWTGLGLASSQAHVVELLGDKITFNALPGVNEELRVIFKKNGAAGIIDGAVLPDAAFTQTAMLAALAQKPPLVHISSHFSFRPGDEARSFLLLGDGTAMTLEEMKRHPGLFAGVELLTLSACNTAAQQADANGREIDGFAELAQRLGAGSVMATLWPVADNSTPWLMREFYQTRQTGNGLTKAEAMRRAQLALLNGTAQAEPLPAAQKGASSPVKIVIGANQKRESANRSGEIVLAITEEVPAFKRDVKTPFAHPYYWAPFILIGNSR